MMSQLQNRKKGLTFGSFKVSKDIKYADKQPIVSWGPRYSRSNVKDMRLNMAISAVFVRSKIFQSCFLKIYLLLCLSEYKVDLKAFEHAVSPTLDEYGEDEGKGLLMGRRILRSLPLVFHCIAVSSLGHTGLLNLIEFLGHATPLFLYNNQVLLYNIILIWSSVRGLYICMVTTCEQHLGIKLGLILLFHVNGTQVIKLFRVTTSQVCVDHELHNYLVPK
ncbi:unnamed protein product [Musa textilis]